MRSSTHPETRRERCCGWGVKRAERWRCRPRAVRDPTIAADDDHPFDAPRDPGQLMIRCHPRTSKARQSGVYLAGERKAPPKRGQTSIATSRADGLRPTGSWVLSRDGGIGRHCRGESSSSHRNSTDRSTCIWAAGYAGLACPGTIDRSRRQHARPGDSSNLT